MAVAAVRDFRVYGGLTLVLLLFGLLYRVSLFQKPVTVEICNPGEKFQLTINNNITERFRKAIQCKTISFDRHLGSTSELLKLKQLIRDSYPLIHSSPFVKNEEINTYSLLYTIKGKNTTIAPYLLTAHLDVVPVNEQGWSVPAFDATIKDGYVYGRGTIDDKHSVMGILEALEFLLSKGFQPDRSFFIAFGHDEEVNGLDGALEITEILRHRGVELDFVLDEGLFILDGVIPGLSSPVALVGVVEKGYLTVELSVEGSGGHSSVPPFETPIGILSRALSRLESRPHRSLFGKGPEAGMFEALAPYANPLYRLVYSNLWLFSWPMSLVLSRVPSQNALVRTTTAITIVNGGVKENVIPTRASALVNHRIHPSQTIEDVMNYDRAIVSDERVRIRKVAGFNPSKISDFDQKSSGFWAIHRSIRQIFPNAVVAPGVMVANTDSRWYGSLSSNVYRFTPAYLYGKDIQRFHGNDERISIDNYEKVINFYVHMIVNSDKEESPEILASKGEL